MRFPLSDWIDSHLGVRHNLGESGMFGSIRHPLPTEREVRAADPQELRRSLADRVGVDPRRLFLTHGATEANGSLMLYLGRRTPSSKPRCRVAFPEYPPLFDGVREAGFLVTEEPGPVDLAVVSQPRNPEGDLWSRDRLETWSEDADHLLVDETFREFVGTASVADLARPRVWASGTFTKFFAGDDLRVGFLVAPEAEADEYARFHGLVCDQVAPYCVAAALACLREVERIRRDVESILRPNRAAWGAAVPGEAVPRAPVAFDRRNIPDGQAFAERALASSVLVCPGRFFGDTRGVRICLTKKTFPKDLAAYLAVRDARDASTPTRPTRRRPRGVRRPPGGSGRARAGRG